MILGLFFTAVECLGCTGEGGFALFLEVIISSNLVLCIRFSEIFFTRESDANFPANGFEDSFADLLTAGQIYFTRSRSIISL